MGEKDEVESNNAGKSMEPSTDLNDVKESEVVNVYYVEPAATMESSSTPSSTVDTDTIAVEMKENKQAATMSSDNIFDIKKSIASTFLGEKERVDRLEATSESETTAKLDAETDAKEIETLEIKEDVINVPVTGRKRRLAKKTAKKLMMPWKKWSS